MAKLESFIRYLNGEVKNGSIYVWGAQGQGAPVISEGWIKDKENSKANAQRAINFWKKQIGRGYGEKLKAFDCSGLAVHWLLKNKLINGDMTANTLRKQCKKILVTDLKQGDFVFKVNFVGVATHIGYVVDVKLNVVEAQGRDHGVVKRPLPFGGWNSYGRPRYFE